LTLILAASLAVSGLTALQLLLTPTQPASAVDAHEFDPTMIISDAVFYNTTTMSASAVQSFLNSKVKTCRDGYTCLKDYRETTRTISADPMCNTYVGAKNETAAQIIYKVSQACGLNPQALIVLLQKEQGLVTDDWPVTRQYRSATGYGCPDTADCDSEYYGFFNQVYKGAWALKRYTMPVGTGPGTEWYSDYSTRYWPGQTSQVLFNPASSCGSSSVKVKNKATTSLYWYTPYQPNQAALDAGYGTGNGCSAYGNRNFFLYFSDWFGSVRYSMPAAFASAYDAAGGPKGRLGEATSQVIKTSSGSWMKFEGGGLYQNSAGKVFPVIGAMFTYYNGAGGITSSLGGPLGAERTLKTGGAVQNFEKGNLYWKTRIGAHLIVDPVQSAWQATGWENGRLGYPTADPVQTSDGVWQSFEGGAFYSNSRGEVFPTWGAIGDHYTELGAMASVLGGPLGQEQPLTSGGAVQEYENGAIFWKSMIGAHHVLPEIRSGWTAAGGDGGALGYPIADQVRIDGNGGGYQQDFQGGSVFASDAGANFAVANGALRDDYLKRGGPAGDLGWPISKMNCTLRNQGCVQSFENGYLYAAPATGAHVVPRSIAAEWRLQGWENGKFGYPVKDAVTSKAGGGGTSQEFEHGGIYVSTTAGTRAMPDSPLRDAYIASGEASGPMGWPVSDINCTLRKNGCVQSFQNGHLYLADTIGARFVPAAVAAPWRLQGWENGKLGYPIGDAKTVTDNGGGVSQDFEGGSIFVSTKVGTITMMNSNLRTAYVKAGGPSSSMGWPVNGINCALRDGGCVESFQNGHLYVTPAHGARFVPTAVAAAWRTRGWENGTLGYPTGDAVSISENGGGVSQEFEGGTIFSSARGGTQTMLKGAIRSGYIDRGGPAGAVGWPVNEANCSLKDGGCVESFQNGHMYTTKATGTHLVDLRIAKLWAANGWEAGKFGYPTSDPKPYNDGVSQSFQHGSIAWTPAKGALVLN